VVPDGRHAVAGCGVDGPSRRPRGERRRPRGDRATAGRRGGGYWTTMSARPSTWSTSSGFTRHTAPPPSTTACRSGAQGSRSAPDRPDTSARPPETVPVEPVNRHAPRAAHCDEPAQRVRPSQTASRSTPLQSATDRTSPGGVRWHNPVHFTEACTSHSGVLIGWSGSRSGTHAQLLARGGTYARLWRMHGTPKGEENNPPLRRGRHRAPDPSPEPSPTTLLTATPHR